MSLLVVVGPSAVILVPVAYHNSLRVVVDVLSRVHLGVQLLLNLSHVLSTSGVKICNVSGLSSTVANRSEPEPGVLIHHVLFHPQVLFSIVRLPDMSLVAVAKLLSIPPAPITVHKVTLVLPLFPSSFALGLAVRDPELGGKVAQRFDTAVFGNRPLIVTIKTTATADILAVVRADDISSGGNSDKKNEKEQHDVRCIDRENWLNRYRHQLPPP